MRLTIVLFAIVLLQACMPALKCKNVSVVTLPRNDKGEIFYSEVFNVEGKTADELYVAALLWFNTNYKSTKAVVQVADPLHKVLICQGIWSFYIEMENSSTNAGETHTADIYATLSHNIVIQCKDGKLKCEIQKIYFEAEYPAAVANKVTYAQSRTNASKLKPNEGYSNCVFSKIETESRSTLNGIKEQISKTDNW
jgi:hypothetical protein